jgi:hypothetical protein
LHCITLYYIKVLPKEAQEKPAKVGKPPRSGADLDGAGAHHGVRLPSLNSLQSASRSSPRASRDSGGGWNDRDSDYASPGHDGDIMDAVFSDRRRY